MKHPLRRLCPLTCLFAAWLVPTQAAEPAPPRNVAIIALKGRVKVKQLQSSTFVTATNNQVLAIGDVIITGDRAEATLKLADESVVRVNEVTTIAISAASQAGGQAEIQFRQGDKGGVHFFDRQGRPTRVTTATASGAILGTEFAVAVAENGATTISVLEGQVDLSDALGSGTVKLTSREQGVVQPGQAPVKSPMLDVIAPIQWTLYYPAVLDPAVVAGVSPELQSARAAYLKGDLLAALEQLESTATPPATAQDALFLAQMDLAAGQSERAQKNLAGTRSPEADALLRLVSVVRGEKPAPLEPTTATAAMAESYAAQAANDLGRALRHARQAVAFAPEFGAAHARVAEMEFSHGHSEPAQITLSDALRLSPRNAQAIVLKGFVLASRRQMSAARRAFEDAIAADPHLGNAWLGRGLTRIHERDLAGGRQDLQVAAALEPNRAVSRSYLGKAYAEEYDLARADHELSRARELDPADPTSWLYAALLHQTGRRLNEGIRDLERSQDLNDNRSVFRSRLLLDQDRAFRSASLAALYRDNGMTDVSVREASRALTADYGNYSAHLFLANSFDQLRDRTGFNLRYETVWFNELLLANLLAPVGAGTFSQNISQQEYSRFFDAKQYGLTTTTRVRSDGQYREEVSQFGTLGKMGYSLDLDYQHNDGVRVNNDLDLIHWLSTFKFQLTPQDTLFLLTEYRDFHSGDNFQYYTAPDPTNLLQAKYTFDESQTPNLLVGYHREWSPGVHTLLLAGRLANDQRFSQNGASLLFVFKETNNIPGVVVAAPFDLQYRSQPEIYTMEASQIFQSERQTLVFGGRYQNGQFETQDQFTPTTLPLDYFSATKAASKDDFERIGGYAYYTLKPLPNLFLTGGVSYDQVTFPRNFRAPPTRGGEADEDAVNPKAALVYLPADWITLRGIYSRSLSGVSLDQDYRLEPAQLAGFVQTFRTVIPESVAGSVSAPKMETAGAAIDLKFRTGTYLGFRAELLSSKANREIGVFEGDVTQFFDTGSIVPSSTRENLHFEERSASLIVNQLLGDAWAAGASYRFTASRLQDHFADIPAFLLNGADDTTRSDLHQFGAHLVFNHPSGFFARAEVNSFFQDNQRSTHTGDTLATLAPTTQNLPSEDFPQFNLYAGWRFSRQRGDLTLGVLNLGGDDYHLNPLNGHPELARERVYAAQLRLRF